MTQRMRVVRTADDRAPRPEPSNRRRRVAAEGRNHDRARGQRLGDVAGRVRHRLADRRLLVRLGNLVPVVEARLDRQRDLVHHLDRLDRILAGGRLGREHHRRRAIENRVRDIGRLGARRLRRMDHRLQHLRRGDHRLPALERLVDDPLLQEWNIGGADLDAEVAAGDHHGVRLGEDLVERENRLGLLDLGNHVRC